jgi:hypothetical protein
VLVADRRREPLPVVPAARWQGNRGEALPRPSVAPTILGG